MSRSGLIRLLVLESGAWWWSTSRALSTMPLHLLRPLLTVNLPCRALQISRLGHRFSPHTTLNALPCCRIALPVLAAKRSQPALLGQELVQHLLRGMQAVLTPVDWTLLGLFLVQVESQGLLLSPLLLEFGRRKVAQR